MAGTVGWPCEINVTSRSTGIHCVVVKRFLSNGARKGGRETATRIHVTEESAHQRGPSLNAGEPGFKDGRNVCGFPIQNQRTYRSNRHTSDVISEAV